MEWGLRKWTGFSWYLDDAHVLKTALQTSDTEPP